MLIVDLNALTAVNGLHFFENIFLNMASALCAQYVVGIDGTFGKRVARSDKRAVFDFGFVPVL